MDEKQLLDSIQTMIKNEIKPVNDRLDKLQAGQDKHSILLENMDKKLNTVIEGQQAHSEQNERQFKKINDTFKNEISLTQSALKTVSKDLRDIIETINIIEDKLKDVKGATAQNSFDVQVLRNRYKEG
ncbi:hypothetical protein [Clostridium kluyveri]|uniref:hypothetical protein n=1 Tax=Clostridium kluyveri TaxID=1534 RepID=UPI002247E255|nr:hypothetical protein [Clostridium kluyveri]UZQ49186.1 hypothetical protein OP486_14630 [Clostridium kluyveri]